MLALSKNIKQPIKIDIMEVVKNAKPKLKLIENDPWLEPYSAAIEGRHQNVLSK